MGFEWGCRWCYFFFFPCLSPSPDPADPFDLRLVGGDTRCSGRLEVLHKGEWGSVCDDGWGEKEEQVVCKQLGCGESIFLSAKARRNFGLGAGRIWLDDVHCSGKEQSLEQCRHRFWGHHNCNHKEDVAVTCLGKSCRWNPRGLTLRELKKSVVGVNSEDKGYSTSAIQLPIIVTYFVCSSRNLIETF